MAFDNEPIIINTTKVPKQYKNNGYLDFLTPNRFLLLGAILIIISTMLPFEKFVIEYSGIFDGRPESRSFSYNLWDKDYLVNGIIVCLYGVFALLATWLESRWIMIVTAVGCLSSTYKVLRAAKKVAYDASIGWGVSIHRVLMVGFYLYIVASILLVIGIVWKFKRDWISNPFA